jgi:DNA (cytosine-5)-methyltransferase 1
MLNGLSLFSGIGGIDLALSEWVRPVAYCEIERYAAAVLFSRMLDGAIPTAPIFPDVTKLTGKILPSIDIIYGGSPCQALSIAGASKGLAGQRSGLFYEFIRLIREIEPEYFFWENVGGSRRSLHQIATTIKDVGYTARAGSLEAAHVGGCHRRERVWILANNTSKRSKCRSQEQIQGQPNRKTIKNGGVFKALRIRPNTNTPKFCRSSNDVPFQLDRIKGLGNAVVPACARQAFKTLMGLK